MILTSLDVIEIDIPQCDGSDFVMAIGSLLKSSVFKVSYGKLSKLAEQYGFSISDDADFLSFDKDNMCVELDRRTKAINTSSSPKKTYGIIIPCNDIPFIFLYDGGSPTYLPYGVYEGNVTNVYRSIATSNEIFVMRACNHFFNPDVCDALCGNSSNIDIARSMPGDIGLNYVYVVFGLLGMPFPDNWANDGAHEDMVKSSNYGFRMVGNEI